MKVTVEFSDYNVQAFEEGRVRMIIDNYLETLSLPQT